MSSVFVEQVAKSNFQKTVVVSDLKGDDTYGKGDFLNPYKTISKAILSVPANGTILIDSGYYAENLLIQKGLNLKAISKHSVVIDGKTTINNNVSNDSMSFDGLNFQNSVDHTFSHESVNSHSISFYECNITQLGNLAFHALNITTPQTDISCKNTQISASISTGGSRAIYTTAGTLEGITLFDCLIGVEDDNDNVCIELNSDSGFVFVGKNINGQVLANGDALVLLAYGGLTTTNNPVLVTNMVTQPAIIANANIISSSNPCVTGTGLFLYTNVLFFNGVALDYAATLNGGAGASTIPIDNAKGLIYRNSVSGLSATNIQAAIDELKTLIGGGNSKTVTQTAHGFTVGQVLKFNGTDYSLAQADTQANLGIWMVVQVIDVNNYVIASSGYFSGLSGGTVNTTSYLSSTVTGGLTSTPPAIVQPIIFWTSSSTGWILGYPASENSVAASGSLPIGSEIFLENSNPDTPAYSSEFLQSNGQVVTDALSPYNGKRIRNLNGATITGVSVTAIDDILKTVTVSLNDIYAFMVGDSLTFDISVPNAVVKSIDYTTGVIEVGDVTLWTSGAFDLTTSSLIGITLLNSVGLKRFTRGNSSNIGGGGVNTLQGFQIQIISYGGSAPSLNGFYRGDNVYEGTGYFKPFSDGINGTPRTSSETSPNYADGVWLKKIK